MKFCLILLFVTLVSSCNISDRKDKKLKVHYYTNNDTSFLFPNEYRRLGNLKNDFESACSSLSIFDEKALFNSNEINSYVRLIYCRAFNNPIAIKIQEDSIYLKEAKLDQDGFDSHYDTSVFTLSEKKNLAFFRRYNRLIHDHKVDSIKIIKQLVSEYPEILDKPKMEILEDRGYRPNADSIIYSEVVNSFNKSQFQKLIKEVQENNFWTHKGIYHESTADGSGFLLEVKVGKSYNIIECSNCVINDLIELRNEILKYTQLKKDEIY